LGFPTGCLLRTIKHFLASLLGRKKISTRGVSHAQSFTLLFVLLYFIFTCIILSKTQKISSFIVVTFTCLLFSLVSMSNPKVEVHTFKQQWGECWGYTK
jgi:hypothetical protein